LIERYELEPMKSLWSLPAQYERWLAVELAFLQALEEAGDVPAGTHAAVERKAHVDVAQIAKIEKEIGHDLLAFIRSVEEQTGRAGRFFHRGLTSSDVKDTALGLEIRDALLLIEGAVRDLRDVLLTRAREHQDLVMVGRTHGMHAEPTTFGLKLLLFHEELGRDLERLERARETISVGKFSGPVGTYSQVSPKVERAACRLLGVAPATAESQILQRDRHAEVLFALAVTGATLEKLALEVRHLSRTEVGEVEEPAPEGSSSMPHKQNPITSERVCGLARLLRAYLQVGLENVPLWHERDMSHSSAERIVFPEGFGLLHYMLVRLTEVVSGLVVRPARMAKNLALTGGAIHSQAALVHLVDRGMPRAAAHQAIERGARRAAEEGISFLEVLRSDPTLGKRLAKDPLDEKALYDRLRRTSRRLIAEGGKHVERGRKRP
jgi:adenylosuccinate lyase